jgi:hypothetical protein
MSRQFYAQNPAKDNPIRKEMKKKGQNAVIVATSFCLQCPRAALALQLDQLNTQLHFICNAMVCQ